MVDTFFSVQIPLDGLVSLPSRIGKHFRDERGSGLDMFWRNAITDDQYIGADHGFFIHDPVNLIEHLGSALSGLDLATYLND